MRQTLVIGASGFVGRHLGAELAAAGHEVVGLARGPAPPGWPVEWIEADARDAPPAGIVFHLALEGIEHALGLAPVVVVTGSGAEYGAQRRLPITEDAPLRPVTPYGERKAEQARLTLAAGKTCARLFNLLGPDLSEQLAPGAFARQIAGGAPVIRTGWLGGLRDYLDVRDAVRALRLLAEQPAPAPGAYNVCSGRPVRTRDLLETMLRLAGSDAAIEERGGPGPADVAEHYGDPSKLERATGWRAEIPLEQSLRDLLDAARRGTARA